MSDTATPLKPMDVYSSNYVPFQVAAWCRMHKFHPKAVELAKIIRAKDELEARINQMERQSYDLAMAISSVARWIQDEDQRETNVKAGAPATSLKPAAVRVVKKEQ